MANKTSSLKLYLQNIGPHVDLNFDVKEYSSLQFAVYAKNGQGKTFISRAIRALEINQSAYTDYAKVLLNNQANKGQFLIKIDDREDSYQVGTSITDINRGLDRIFYTFNSDYITENLSENHFNPNGNITGFVLGKSNIDLSDEKAKLNHYREQIKNAESTIASSIEKKKKEILKYGITSRLGAYKEIDITNIQSYHNQYDNLNYLNCLNDIATINQIDDDIQDIREVYFSCGMLNEFDSVKQLLSTEYSLNTFEEGFRKHVNLHLDFITNGLTIMKNGNEEECPFCHQKLFGDSFKLVHDYIAFVNDQESRVSKAITGYLEDIDTSIEFNKKVVEQVRRAKNDTKAYERFFGTINELDIEALENNLNNLDSWLLEVRTALEKKKGNISKEIDINPFGQGKNIQGSIDSINKQIRNYNKHKNNTTTQKNNLKKDLCHAAIKLLVDENSENIEKINTAKKEYQSLEHDIREKEMQSKKSKKELVAHDFEKYLNSFFYGKYRLNKETFALYLNSQQISKNADKVLSDGEKTILAFCYYLANIHTVVNNENDYDKLILVIDDPISSMDIDYIYQMVALIKNYGLGNDTRHEKY